jgi:hypothetical protein
MTSVFGVPDGEAGSDQRHEVVLSMQYIFFCAAVLLCVGALLHLLKRRRRSEASAAADDWQRTWDARLAALQSVFGPADDDILTSVIPFYLGGSADVLAFRKHNDGICYVTAGIIGDASAKPNKHGQYELMICVREPAAADWAPNLVGTLARHTTEAVLSSGETMDIAPALPQPASVTQLLFLNYADINIQGKNAGVLLCLGINADEVEYIKTHGLEPLVKSLEQADVYPFTDLNRPSVITNP